jgi:hypothetical protein
MSVLLTVEILRLVYVALIDSYASPNMSTLQIIPVLKAFKEKFVEACNNNDVKAIVITGKFFVITEKKLELLLCMKSCKLGSKRKYSFTFHLIFLGESGKFSGGFDIATLLEVQDTGNIGNMYYYVSILFNINVAGARCCVFRHIFPIQIPLLFL